MRIGARALGCTRYSDPLHQLDRPVEPGGSADLAIMDADLLDDLRSDLVNGIERAHRVLEDHRDPPPRILRNPRCSRSQLSALEHRTPLELAFGERVSPISVIEVTDLPEPDSPTIATTSPGSTVKLTPSTARTLPSSVAKVTRRSSTGLSSVLAHAGNRTRGSSAA